MVDDLREAAIARLTHGSDLEGLGLRRLGVRWDLRELRLDPLRRIGGRKREVNGSTVTVGGSVIGGTSLKGVEWTDIDFSGASMPDLDATETRIRNCLFNGTSLPRARFRGELVERCSFNGANLQDSFVGLGGGNRATWNDVSFDGADLRRFNPGRALFTDCRFHDARLDGVEFDGPDLERCSFSGHLRDVTFYGHRPLFGVRGHRESLRDVDFSGAVFEFVGFRNLDLSAVTLPKGSWVIHFSRPREVLNRLVARLRPLPPSPVRALLGIAESELRWLGPHRKSGFLVPSDVAGAEHDARQLIAEAIHACGASVV